MEIENSTLTHEFGAIDTNIEDLFLTFYIGDHIYGVEIHYVREIVNLQKITKVPGLVNYLKGLINLRGQVIPVIDVRLRFGLESKEYSQQTCFIVVEVDFTMIGLIVDRVSDVLLIPENLIQSAPASNKEDIDYFVKSLGKVENNVQFLLDLPKVITHPQFPSG